MNRTFGLAALALLLLLAACKAPSPVPNQAGRPAADTPSETSRQEPADEPAVLSRLTIELVVDWEETDRILSSLDRLSGLLSDGLLAQGYAVEELTVTLSTAGGITGSALAEGGIDAACMPAADYVEYESLAAAILITDDAAGVVAVTAARTDLEPAFQEALAAALLDPETQFLALCYPDTAYVPASQEALQALHSQTQEAVDHGG